MIAIKPASAQTGPDIFVTPIANAPFSAVVSVERMVMQPGGTMAAMKTIREIGRDNQGRIHNEMRVLEPVTDPKTPVVTRIHLYDPVSRTTAYLFPRQKTYTTEIVNHPPRTEPPDSYASPEGSTTPASQFTQEQDLGMREIYGQQAHGVRETQTIPAESSPTGKELIITDEYWYSEDLHINLKVRHTDARIGSVSMTVSQVKRAEPDPAFFEIPADYKPATTQRR